MMTDALRLEVKKDKWEQLQNGTYKLQVTVNPADLNDNADDVLLQFIKAGMGERFMMGVAKIGPDEQPEQPKAPEKPKRAPATTRAEKARRLCGVAQFQDWIINRWPMQADGEETQSRYELASNRVKTECGVQSKNDLVLSNPTAIRKFDALLTTYEQQAGRMAERH